MPEKLLEINNLNVSVEDKSILNNLNLAIKKGETHVLMGPNGAGKSTLGKAIIGHPKYKIEVRDILFEEESILNLSTDLRAKKGIFLSFQNPEEISGITVENFIRTSISAISGQPLKLFAFKKELEQTMESLNMHSSYGARYLNVGFSGGEKKKSETLQLLMLKPKLAILDETDSGLDVDAVKTVSQGIKQYKNENNALLIITHNTKILEFLKVDYVHILMNGTIVKTGSYSLISKVNKEGYKPFGSHKTIE